MARHSRSTIKIMESSLFLMASTGLTAGLGFVFWILVDRSYSPQRVGLAASLINTISLISYLSLFGFNSSLVRFQARDGARNRQVTMSLLITGAGGAAFGTAFLVLLPWLSPKLEFIRANPLYALLFVAFCGFAAVNLLTDSVFMAARLPQYNMLVDGVLQSLSKLAMPIFLVTFGAVGIVASTGIGYAVAVIASLAVMYRRLGFRIDVGTRGTLLRKHARYSLASYGSSILNLLPQLVLPIIALQKLGSETEAYYFMAFQVANMLYAASHAIGEATFSEASHDISRLAECLKRSARLNLVVLLPAVTIVALGASLVLSLFGQAYAAHARTLLVLLSLGTFAVALNNWSSNALRVSGRMRPFLVSNALFAAVSIGMAAASASRGVLWVGGAWVVGNLVCGLAALVYIPWDTPELADAAVAADAGEAAPAGLWDGAGLWDDTVPLVLPWLTSDRRRMGSVRPPRTSPTGAAATAQAVMDDPRDGTLHSGGDMAVRERTVAGRGDDQAGFRW
jgi:O-antigen/teichoic acid export membrane protein